MSIITEIVASRLWVHRPSGRKVSIFGAVPWTSERDRDQWEIRIMGWTWRVVDAGGRETFGIGRPVATEPQEAVDVANAFNALSGRETRTFKLEDVPA